MAPKDEMDDAKPFKSTLGMRYPSLREYPIKTGDVWMEGKKIDDDYRDLWRIHDGLYDLSSFVKSHPGGSDWLEWTQGTDITEAFEAHHIYTGPQKLLQKFFVKKATTPRDAPFHFKEDGFYKTIKREVREALKDIPKWPAMLSNLYADFLLTGYLVCAVLSAAWNNYWIATLAGLFLGLVTIASHNYIHRKANFRMYYLNFSTMSWRDWRITHVLSHHLYPNTINDLEISVLEPMCQYLPWTKSKWYLKLAWWYQPIFYAIFFILGHLKGMVHKALWKIGLVPYKAPMYWDDFLGYIVLIPMYWFNGSLQQVLLMFFYILLIAGIHFGIIGINAAHRDPEIFLDGDASRPLPELDWGVYQLDSVVDRSDISKFQFLVLTSFGDHALHHLFPTLDHGLLRYLYPIFNRNCEKFGVNLLIKTHWEVMKGHFTQLLRTEPKTTPPKPLKLAPTNKKEE
ncbi:cytochrome b5-related protein-like isoform X1 [Agrilus planipennis]|uniref:Cytochrome b5-related protein-like isoform X1 n=1 Tax=Agrilus planipennis TaxID=224129 RepID=A0A1W4WNV6_AGRPL|nr:cytochrome b5-related protein-like isoform X1 [Agrilus planipennis]